MLLNFEICRLSFIQKEIYDIDICEEKDKTRDILCIFTIFIERCREREIGRCDIYLNFCFFFPVNYNYYADFDI